MTKTAIVGMEACFGSCENLDSLDRSFYDGERLFGRDAGFQASDSQVIAMKVIAGAIQDSGVEAGSRVAVILAGAEESLAAKISTLWNFEGVTLVLDSASAVLMQGLETARTLLRDHQVDAVVLGSLSCSKSGSKSAPVGSPPEPLAAAWRYDQQCEASVLGAGAGAVVLKRLDSARRDNHRIYATVDAVARVSAAGSASVIHQACEQAHRVAGIAPASVGYVEICGSGTLATDELEIAGLTAAYRTTCAEERLSCAVGSATANIGYAGAAAGMASLIRTALCLYHRYIPAVPGWSAPRYLEQWKDTAFYVAQSSRSWLPEASRTTRTAAISEVSAAQEAVHLVLSEEPSRASHSLSSRYLVSSSLHLLPVAGRNIDELRARLAALQRLLCEDIPLVEIARQTFVRCESHYPYAIALVGETRQGLVQETERALAGLAAAFAGEDWQTPAGSYFTAAPLGESGQVAFVYPGAFNAYLGLGQDQLRLFPELHRHAILKHTGDRYAQVARSLYPRSLKTLSRRQLEKLENKFLADPKMMFDAEMACASLTTAILQDGFRLKPEMAFGYSLGETSMMVAQGIFPASEFGSGRRSFDRSPLFNGRLSGAQNAVRECWGLPTLDANEAQAEARSLWRIYAVLAPIEAVERAITSVERVYITQINAAEEVIIAGAPDACQQVLQALDRPFFKVPFSHVIHCLPVVSERTELEQLHTFSVQDAPSTRFYTAASGPIELTQASVSQSIAQGLCQTLDFPKLVRRTYEDGARVFVEVGAGGSCSRLIDQILGQQPHLAVALNIRGMRDRTALLKAIARLVSHRVDLDLSTLYSTQPGSTKPNPNKPDPSSLSQALLAAGQTNDLVSESHSLFLSGRRVALQQFKEMAELQLKLSETMISSNISSAQQADDFNSKLAASTQKTALTGGAK